MDRAAKRALQLRVENIARTESIWGLTPESRIVEEAARQGTLDRASFRRFWLVTPDDRLCPECRAIPGMNPDGVRLDEPFQTPGGPFCFRHRIRNVAAPSMGESSMSDPLRQTAQTRLATLRQELATGRDALTQLEQRRVQIAETLLRIEGAVQVLEELLSTPETWLESADAPAGDAPREEPLCPNPNADALTILPKPCQRSDWPAARQSPTRCGGFSRRQRPRHLDDPGHPAHGRAGGLRARACTALCDRDDGGPGGRLRA